MSIAHEMTRTESPEPGVDEWSCTRCSRRLLLRRPPAFEKVVLDRGDEWAMHVGATGGLRLGPMEANPAGPVNLPKQDRGWLADHGIEWRPDDAG